MGDRGNIVVRDSGGKDVVFYTHWAGYNIAAVVRRALAKECRWEDDPYLARIIFCELVKGNEEEETGFGIGRFTAADRQHPVVLVDIKKQMVFLAEGYKEDAPLPEADVKHGYSFRDWAKMTDEEATAMLDSRKEEGR